MRAGWAMAHLLRGSWRPVPPPTAPAVEVIERALPLLAANRVEGLAWWRLRATPLTGAAALAPLREAYRRQGWQALAQQARLAQVDALLDQAGIEAIHYKGATLAALYPHPAPRPYGDLDFAVWPDQLDPTKRLLARAGYGGLCDPRGDYPDLPGRSAATIYTRTRRQTVAGHSLRVLSHEDHLVLVCWHFQRHGGRRALWLCDVALLLETRPPDFDWPYVLSGPAYATAGVLCTLGLAHHLLGARLEGTPLQAHLRPLPRWLIPSVLYAWERPLSLDGPTLHRRPSEDTWTLTRRRWFTPLQTACRFKITPRSPLVRPLQVARFARHTLWR